MNEWMNHINPNICINVDMVPQIQISNFLETAQRQRQTLKRRQFIVSSFRVWCSYMFETVWHVKFCCFTSRFPTLRRTSAVWSGTFSLIKDFSSPSSLSHIMCPTEPNTVFADRSVCRQVTFWPTLTVARCCLDHQGPLKKSMLLWFTFNGAFTDVQVTHDALCTDAPPHRQSGWLSTDNQPDGPFWLIRQVSTWPRSTSNKLRPQRAAALLDLDLIQFVRFPWYDDTTESWLTCWHFSLLTVWRSSSCSINCFSSLGCDFIQTCCCIRF